MRTAEGFAQRAGAALKPQIDGFAQAEEGKLSQNTDHPGVGNPERLE